MGATTMATSTGLFRIPSPVVEAAASGGNGDQGGSSGSTKEGASFTIRDRLQQELHDTATKAAADACTLQREWRRAKQLKQGKQQKGDPPGKPAVAEGGAEGTTKKKSKRVSIMGAFNMHGKAANRPGVMKGADAMRVLREGQG
jgi:hypothetical protein